MKKVITAIILSFAAQGAFASGFSPWTSLSNTTEQADAMRAETSPAGFAPWRSTTEQDYVETGIAVDIEHLNVFRPWS